MVVEPTEAYDLERRAEASEGFDPAFLRLFVPGTPAAVVVDVGEFGGVAADVGEIAAPLGCLSCALASGPRRP